LRYSDKLSAVLSYFHRERVTYMNDTPLHFSQASSDAKPANLLVNTAQVILKTVNIEKIYQSFQVQTVALDKINLEIKQGEFVSIMGPSGCGKSSLLNLLALLDKPSGGQIFFKGQEVSQLSDKARAAIRKQHLGFVFQHFNLIEELNVFENVELPLAYQRLPSKQRKERVKEVLEQLEIAHKKDFFPAQLSGGQQQRVAIARAIVSKPHLLLADEPTGNLDSAQGQEVMELFTQLNEAGTTVVLVTHSQMNAEYSQRTIHLFDGQIVTENIVRVENKIV